MREILFRGKRVDSGEWVEGFYVKKTDPLFDGFYHYIVEQHGKESFVTWHPVDHTTVGQYMGCLDFFGDRIFEGDVVRLAERYGDVVAVIEYHTTKFVARGKDFNYPAHAEMCVIGNIHDNPEMIGGKEDATV